MRPVPTLLAVLVFMLIIIAGRESQAVIYQYVNDQGTPTYTDDMLNIPEQYRESAVIVSGAEADDNAESIRELERAEAAARLGAENGAPHKVGTPLGKKLLWSGVITAFSVILLVVLAHIDALKDHARIVKHVRSAIIASLVVYLSVTYAGDLAGLFTRAGSAVPNPVAGLQEHSAARGRKAAAAMRAMGAAMEARQPDDADSAQIEEIKKELDRTEQGR